VADDGGQEARRRSGERWWSEQERTSEMCVWKRKTECARSFRGVLGVQKKMGLRGSQS
jgi:hypothetical protein